jgi:hypothetical protein
MGPSGAQDLLVPSHDMLLSIPFPSNANTDTLNRRRMRTPASLLNWLRYLYKTSGIVRNYALGLDLDCGHIPQKWHLPEQNIDVTFSLLQAVMGTAQFRRNHFGVVIRYLLANEEGE